ncbi:primosomal protein N' [Corynebacterium sp. 3HC-13]|uniref:primosomal protein N' n=1 Tax=Corynebacterium poyangense TaxID=2684405 RepID=UPI001CCA1BA8|nr:primosomal protein N' [Corynebacterium poyangense]MBZ8177854.1 primosomal protein N' [Corynebacterium poyangense]
MASSRVPASHQPVARVLPLLGVPHLDRPFDYLVPEKLSDHAQPGVRVRVRFSGRLIDGIVLERCENKEHQGSLRFIERVISPFQVYPERTARLVDSLADRYGGIRSDIIRSAVPSRHAAAENSDFSTPWEHLGHCAEPDLSAWSSYQFGPSFVDAVIARRPARAAWQVLPGEDWAAPLAALAAKVVRDGAGALLVLPDQRDVERMETALRQLVSARQITVMNAALGPQARYRRFLSVLMGQGRLVVGTRSAAFAPVKDLALAVILHDGDDSLVDPRAPYTHAREVLSTRSAQEGCALVIAGYSRTAETQLLVEAGWAHDLVAPREVVRQKSPWMRAVGDSDFELARDPRARHARLPKIAFEAIRQALDRDRPVLVQVPRKGYIPVLACGHCRTPARCRHCNGPLELPMVKPDETAVPTCRWCGRPDPHYRCAECGSTSLRAVVLGASRTVEELGPAFPGVPILLSGGNRVLNEVSNRASVVVSTPGAEPVVEDHGRYGAAVLLDTWSLLGRQSLRATEDTLATWFQAASHVEPAAHGGQVVVVADNSLIVVQDFLSWDSVAAARRELQQRREAHFPPAVHLAAIDGLPSGLSAFIDTVQLPEGAEVLGPVDLPPGVTLPGEWDKSVHGDPQRIILRCPLGPRNELGQALRTARVARSVRKDDSPLRIQVDPLHIG